MYVRMYVCINLSYWHYPRVMEYFLICTYYVCLLVYIVHKSPLAAICDRSQLRDRQYFMRNGLRSLQRNEIRAEKIKNLLKN